MGKITSYPSDASPSSDDIIITVNDPLGVPANKKVTLSSVWVPAESASTRASSVQANVANESSSRVSADNALDTKAESASTRASSVQANVTNESSSRVSADNALDTKAESASTRASSVQANVVAESSSRVSADNALDTKAESASTRASSAAVNAATADSKAVSVELQFSYIATTTITSASTLSSEQIQGGFIMVSAAITTKLPPVVIGAVVTVYSTGANAIVVDPDDADRIILNGVDKTDGVAITSASGAGDYVTLLGDSASGWTVIGRSGSWV